MLKDKMTSEFDKIYVDHWEYIPKVLPSKRYESVGKASNQQLQPLSFGIWNYGSFTDL
jgi:hypothetical protein